VSSHAHAQNWDRVWHSTASEYAQPASEVELAAVLTRANTQNVAIRAIGAGHSFSPLCVVPGGRPSMHINLDRMRHVLSAERDLHEQTLAWSLIEASSAIGCPVRAESLLPTLSATRLRFDTLQRRLVGALARENIGALGDELDASSGFVYDFRQLFPAKLSYFRVLSRGNIGLKVEHVVESLLEDCVHLR
jgi:hypothetical protein